MARFEKDGDHIGEVILVRGIVGAKLVDMLPKRGRIETVEADIDLPNLSLFGCGGLVLNNGFDISVGTANNPAIAGGILEIGSDHGGGGTRFAEQPNE